MRLLSVLCAVACAGAAQAKTLPSFMPPNDLAYQDSLTAGGGLSQAEFNAVIARAEAIYKPIFKQRFGATLTVERRWSDATVNAYAEQPSRTDWRVTMFGGLARRPEVTPDGFALVLCHEIGHHLSGYPYVDTWAGDEGNSDYFSTAVCAQKLFGANAALDFGDPAAELPQSVIAKCDGAHAAARDRAVCYRSATGAKGIAELLGGGAGSVAYDRPDRRVVTRTNHAHPEAQCRLDTYLAGALCGAYRWDDGVIPGKRLQNRNSKQAQDEAFAHSCTAAYAARPRCWFAALR